MKDKTTQFKELIFKNSQFSPSNQNFQYLPLKEEQIIEFEERHQISLPEYFRNFLTQVGNGGPGPGTGIIPLKIDKTYSNLSLPWINPREFNRRFQYNGEEDFNVFSNRMDQVFKDNSSDAVKMYRAADNGSLCIADAGGGTYYNLVLDGPHKGQVWVNALVGDGGFVKQAESFEAWYENWLDQNIQQAEENHKANKKLFSNEIITAFTPLNLQQLHDFVGHFRKVSNKQPVHQLFDRLLKEEGESLPGILQACIEYTLRYPEFEDYKLALKLIKKASKNPNEELLKTMYCQEGAALVGLGRFRQAIGCFEKALEIEDDEYYQGELDDKYAKLLSFCHLNLGNLGQAERALLFMDSEGDEIYDIDTVVSLLDDCYRVHKDYLLAKQWGQFILDLRLFQDDEESEEYLSDIYQNIIYAHAWLKNEDQVHLFMDKLVQLKPNKEMVPYEIIAEELIRAKSYSIALEYLDVYASFSRAKENQQGLCNLVGYCYDGLGSFEEATIHFRKSFQIHHWIVPYTNLIRCYIKLEKYGKAQQIFNEIVDFDPYYPWTYYQFALYHIKMNDEHKVVTLLNKAISLGFDKNEILTNPDYKAFEGKLG